MRFLIVGLARHGIQSETFFHQDLGGGDLFRALCPVHWESETPLEQVIRNGQFDAIIVVTSSLTIGFAEAARKARFEGPILGVCHGDYIIGWNRTNANGIVALTGWWADKIRSFTDLPVHVVGNPVDLERFRPPADPSGETPILAWVGRAADPKKHIERLLEVMVRLPADAYSVHVVDSNVRDRPEEMFGAETHRLGFYGCLQYDQMPAFYARVAASGGVLLFTSAAEALPMVLLEAMACGCPVIVPDAWGSDQIVEHGRTGFVVRRSEGPEAILQCLQILRDPGIFRSHSTRARQLMEEKYSLESVTQQYLNALTNGPARRDSPAARAAWGFRTAAFYARRLPTSVFHYRPRRAHEAIIRAVRAQERGSLAAARSELLDALAVFPPAYLKPWRAKFLLRTLLKNRA